MVRVVWSEGALDDIASAVRYLMERNPRAGAELALGLRAAGDSLEHFPLRGRPVLNSTLRELVTDFPYIIRYRVRSDAVRILRVRHMARRPTRL